VLEVSFELARCFHPVAAAGRRKYVQRASGVSDSRCPHSSACALGGFPAPLMNVMMVYR